MKINLSRQNIYLLSLFVFLLIFVLLFAFSVLIPKGKEYRNDRADLKKEVVELKKYEDFRDAVLEKLTELKSENRHIITALDTAFDSERFQKIHSPYFNSLTISKKTDLPNEEDFSVYEVNTISEINSPTSFYDFLDAVNKSDWIISVNFPISFIRENEIIRSSFTMKVYSVDKDIKTKKSITSE